MEDIYIWHQQQKTSHKYARGTRSEGFGIVVFNISTKMTNEGSVVVICVLKNIHWLCLLKEDKSMGNHAGTCSLREYLVSVQLYFETFTWTRESELMTAKMMITHPKDMTRWQTNEAKIYHHLLSFPSQKHSNLKTFQVSTTHERQNPNTTTTYAISYIGLAKIKATTNNKYCKTLNKTLDKTLS